MSTDPIDPDGFKKADETLKYGEVGEHKQQEVCPWCEGHPPCEYEMGYEAGKQKQREEVERALLDVLEEHFPKQNQCDPSKPSPNGRGVAMSYRGLLLLKMQDIWK